MELLFFLAWKINNETNNANRINNDTSQFELLSLLIQNTEYMYN